MGQYDKPKTIADINSPYCRHCKYNKSKEFDQPTQEFIYCDYDKVLKIKLLLKLI
jgi:hypothetical protein